MSPLLQGIVIALVPLGVLQIGTMIFFCGVVVTSLRNVNQRVERLEDWRDAHELRHRIAGEGITS